MKFYKKAFIAVPLMFLACQSLASSKDYNLNLTVDNKPKYSMDMITDISYSSISGLAYLSDQYSWNSNILYRIGAGYGAILLTTFNHEVGGHANRVKEFGGKLKKINVDLDASGYVSYKHPAKHHYQKESMIDIAGMESNFLLSKKIADNLISDNQKMDPITAFGYIFSAGDQAMYASSTKSNDQGDDIASYRKNMEKLYGKGSTTVSKIKSTAMLDLIDPFMLASVNSIVTGENVEVPKLKITDNFGVAPYARMVLTPFGTIERKFGAYIFTEYTPVRIAFGHGKQSKKSEVAKENNIPNAAGAFNGLKADEKINNESSYSVDLSIYKLFELAKVNVGLDVVYWKQPELFVDNPFKAKSKTGFLFVVKGRYALNDTMSILAKAGYKDKGYVPGYIADKTALVSVGLNYKL